MDIKKKLREKEVPHDLAEAEDLLKKHQDLKDDILAGRERWRLLVHSSILITLFTICFATDLTGQINVNLIWLNLDLNLNLLFVVYLLHFYLVLFIN